ncbi:MAG: arsenate reductase ArsC, partial [Rhodothermales bacterium]
SARSQMAEGLLTAFHGERYRAFSAGTHPGRVNPFAIRAMEEIGIDLGDHYSKSVDDLGDQLMDVVVTVCDSAKEACPYVPAKERIIHHSFEDPSVVEGDDEAKLAAFRRIRDEIRVWIDSEFG